MRRFKNWLVACAAAMALVVGIPLQGHSNSATAFTELWCGGHSIWVWTGSESNTIQIIHDLGFASYELDSDGKCYNCDLGIPHL